MTTLKKKIETTIKKEVEVNLPYFSKVKNEKVFYKVLSAERMVRVSLYSFNTGVEYTGSVELALDSGCVECLELEFNTAFAEAMNKLNGMMEKKTKIKLEVGKSYQDRVGNVVMIVSTLNVRSYLSDDHCYYHGDGTFLGFEPKSDYDLIKEVD